jgi:serine/threonine-protein kinase
MTAASPSPAQPSRSQPTINLRPRPAGAAPPTPAAPPAAPAAAVQPTTAFTEYLPASQAVIARIIPDTDLGPYRIGARIGIGGMGVVHRAIHRDSGAAVAIKFLIVDDAEQGERQLRRFQQEARIVGQLRHPAIVTVTELSQLDGLSFMVMELFLGPYDRPVNLADYAARFGAANGLLDEQDTRDIMLVLLDAIAYAHRHGVVHCDLKPENILFQSLGLEGDHWRAHLKLTDFGVAKVVGEGLVHQSVTQSISKQAAGDTLGADAVALLGTYDYMAPEQRRGESATFASDIYAVGLMLYRFLTGQTELGLRRPSELRSGLNRAWDTVILKALQENPAQRYPDADAFAAALHRLG